MSDPNHCPRCGKAYDHAQAQDLLAGMCPNCLAVASMSDTNLEISGPGTLPKANSIQVAPAPALTVGATFRSLEVLEILGQGGMGVVYKARHTSLNRLVALKILSPQWTISEELAIRFDREAKIQASLNHPNIVQVYDFGKEVGVHYLTMEYVDGPTLEAILERNVRPKLVWLLTVLRDVARGLQKVHEAGLVHRDLKPANILIAKDGTAKIGDFGLALQTEDRRKLTENGVFVGTPHYVSPEHAQGKKVDGRSDLYALGVILYQGVAGRPPFAGASATAILIKHIQEQPPPLHKVAPHAPPILGEITRKLLAKNPASRHDTARDLERDLDRAIQVASTWKSIEEGEPRKATVRRVPASPPKTRGMIKYTLAGLAMAVVLLTLLLILGGEDRPSTQGPIADSPAISPPQPVPASSSTASSPVSGKEPSSTSGSKPQDLIRQEPTPRQDSSETPPQERRRRLEYYASVINLAAIAASYAELQGMKNEVDQLRKSMTQNEERIASLVAGMRRDGQSTYVDDTLRPTDRLVTFENEVLAKIGKERTIALLGTFVAKVKGGTRARVGVVRDGKPLEFVIRFDERSKDLVSIVQVVGLIQGQEVTAPASAANAPPTSTEPTIPVTKGTDIPQKVDPSPPRTPEVKKSSAPMKKPLPPDAAATKEAENLVREVFKDDYAKKSPADKVGLAKKLLKQGLEPGNDAATTYVIFREARDLAAQFGDLTTALLAISELSTRFETDVLEMKANALGSIAKVARSPEEHAAVAKAYAILADEAMLLENFESADRASATGSLAARKSKYIPILATLETKAKQCGELRSRFEQAKKARETLSNNSEDPAAKLALGQYLCIVKGDWDSGLALLAKGSDPDLRAAAERDLSGPTQADSRAELGDKWFTLSGKYPNSVERRSIRERGRFWYELALPDLAGPARVRVEKRLSELSREIGR